MSTNTDNTHETSTYQELLQELLKARHRTRPGRLDETFEITVNNINTDSKASIKLVGFTSALTASKLAPEGCEFDSIQEYKVGETLVRLCAIGRIMEQVPQTPPTASRSPATASSQSRPTPDTSHLPYATIQRLRLLEIVADVNGSVGREIVIQFFGVSEAAVTRDLALYQDLDPLNILYDGSNRIYIKLPSFQRIWN